MLVTQAEADRHSHIQKVVYSEVALAKNPDYDYTNPMITYTVKQYILKTNKKSLISLPSLLPLIIIFFCLVLLFMLSIFKYFLYCNSYLYHTVILFLAKLIELSAPAG